ncbi:MAG: hypothetical protein VW600_13700, partial [Ferrovibrio sp.]
MQVAQVNSSVASTLGQNPAEENPTRADDFARVLQTAVYGKGSEAVAKTTERAMSAATPRTETRPVERPSRDRSEQQPSQQADTRTDTRTDTAPRRSDDASAAAKTDDRPPVKDTTAKDASTKDSTAKDAAAKDKAADKPADANKTPSGKTDETAAKQDAAKAAQQTADAVAKDGEPAEEAEETLPEDAKPVVAAAPDASVILALLQA